MKHLFTTYMTPIFMISIFAAPGVQASDWTIPANSICEVALGNAVSSYSGYKATGGTAVITCSLTKKVGSNNLNHVFARINRSNPGGAAPFCSLTSYQPYGSPSDTTYAYASNGSGNKSLSLPLPNSSYSGYLTVGCVLNNGDTLYGVRYGQD